MTGRNDARCLDGSAAISLRCTPARYAARSIAAAPDHPERYRQQEPPMGIIGLLVALILIIIVLRLIA
jgi:hypothetical protein